MLDDNLICHDFFWYPDVYLRSDHWHKVRDNALGRAGYRCEDCGNRYQLHVHHRVYRLWEEREGDVVVLCKKCHFERHSQGSPRFQDLHPPRPCCLGQDPDNRCQYQWTPPWRT
jgi:hypothetical protein